MAAFGIRFFLSNILICIIIGFLLIAKRIWKHYLTSRIQFHLWYLLFWILAVPFIPFRPLGFPQALAWLSAWKKLASSNMNPLTKDADALNIPNAVKQINDFALSVSSEAPSALGFLFCIIWLAGIIAMVLSMAKSISRLNTIKMSALPLQDKNVRAVYYDCLREMNIKRIIPVYSTAFLKSPVITGFFHPCIYLPLHLISDFNAVDMRYILLHEFQHYKHKDALAGYLMNLFGILYWFNPLVWYALKEMRIAREIACDASVLNLLNENDYKDYGNTLISFAEKISLRPFPFTAGISGTMKQMQARIIHISTYKKPSAQKTAKGLAAFFMTAFILLGVSPMLSTYAADQNRYHWDSNSETISIVDLSAYFDGYEGSFVLYDQKNGTWKIYDMEHATLRTSPNSTYKIYDALFGLEESVITPKDSFLSWDGTEYPFEAWNADQDLHSAMQSSVNWYFQEIDEQLGIPVIRDYIEKLGYGNENLNSDLSSYWMQSTLKISPVEQVMLLRDLYDHNLDFALENVNAVKDSIRLVSSESGNFYGKTGTGRVDGQDVNGWFVGFVENDNNTYFFATNIQNDADATGSHAVEITKSILSYLNICK